MSLAVGKAKQGTLRDGENNLFICQANKQGGSCKKIGPSVRFAGATTRCVERRGRQDADRGCPRLCLPRHPGWGRGVSCGSGVAAPRALAAPQRRRRRRQDASGLRTRSGARPRGGPEPQGGARRKRARPTRGRAARAAPARGPQRAGRAQRSPRGTEEPPQGRGRAAAGRRGQAGGRARGAARGRGLRRAASVGLREFSTRAPEPPRRRPPLRTGGPRDGDSPGAASRARGGEATGRGASEEKRRRRRRRRGGPWRCGGPAARRGAARGGGAGRATLASACDAEPRRRSDGDGTTGPRLRGGKGRAGLRLPAEGAPPRTSQRGARRRPRGTRPRVWTWLLTWRAPAAGRARRTHARTLARTHAGSEGAARPDPRAPGGLRARPCSRSHVSPPWTLGRRRPGGFLCPPAVLSSRGADTPARRCSTGARPTVSSQVVLKRIWA
ncbi:hypothetical protein VULLAG_LOCUS7125 [Vulpes lagopus]